jgi:hypothetical protein
MHFEVLSTPRCGRRMLRLERLRLKAMLLWTTDRAGRPVWTMIYRPGAKARAEYQVFTQRGGGPMVIETEPVRAETEPEPAGLERELVIRGMNRGVAAALVRDFPADRIESQIESVDRPQRKIQDKAAYLVSAIREDFATKTVDPPVKVAPVSVARATEPEADRLTEAELAHWRDVATGGDRVQARLARIILANHDRAADALEASRAGP